MSWSAAFTPRDESLAKRLVLVLTMVATAVTVAVTLLVPVPDTGVWGQIALAGPVTVLVAAVAIRVTAEPPAWLWMSFPLGATIVIALSDLATRDATVTAQIFFFFPALYAGAQLRRRAGMVLIATAAVAELVVTFAVLPPRIAVADATYVIAALSSAVGLLIYSGERVDRLITRLRQQAAIDPLTGLVTRRVLDSAASTALQSAASDGGTALLLIDLDHFKSINDVHGHLAGDLVLQQVAAVLRSAGRSTDVVSRMGGDEFAILMPGCALDPAINRARCLVNSLRTLRVDLGPISMSRDSDRPTRIQLTASVGVAHLPTHALNVQALYHAADISLYRAKRCGRNQVADTELDAA